MNNLVYVNVDPEVMAFAFGPRSKPGHDVYAYSKVSTETTVKILCEKTKSGRYRIMFHNQVFSGRNKEELCKKVSKHWRIVDIIVRNTLKKLGCSITFSEKGVDYHD